MGTFAKFMTEEAMPINEIDISPAVDRGLMAYWREIRMSFPNAKTKDLMPDVAKEFRNAADKATREWLKINGTPTKDTSVSYSSFNRNPNAIQTSQWNNYHP